MKSRLAASQARAAQTSESSNTSTTWSPIGIQTESVAEPTGSPVIVGGESKGSLGRSVRAPLLSLFVRPRLTMLVSTERHADLAPLTELIDTGQLTPSLDATYTLDRASDAIRHLEAGTVRVKTSILVTSDPIEARA